MRPGDGDYPDIEIMVSANERGLDEDLPQPAARSHPLLHRAKRPVGIVLLLAVLALAIYKVSHFGRSDSVDASKESPTPTASTSVRPGDLAGLGVDVNLPQRHVGGELVTTPDGSCPKAVVVCERTTALPAEAAAMLRVRFPVARLTSSESLLLVGGDPPKLYFRKLHLEAPERFALDVTVSVAVPSDVPDTESNGDQDTIRFVRVLVAGFRVDVLAVAPKPATMPSYDALRVLGRDERLFLPR